MATILKFLKTHRFEGEEDKQRRRGFVQALGNYGPDAEPALDCLVDLLEEKINWGEHFLMEEVVRALTQIGPSAYKKVPGIKELGKNPSETEISTFLAKKFED